MLASPRSPAALTNASVASGRSPAATATTATTASAAATPSFALRAPFLPAAVVAPPAARRSPRGLPLHGRAPTHQLAQTLREPRGQVLDRLDGKSSAALKSSEERNSKLAAGDRNQTKVVQGQWDFSPDITFETKSSTVVSVEDLCNSLDTGENPRGGEHGAVARGNIDLIFGFVESHVRGGKQIDLPLKNHGHYRLDRITDTAYGYGNVPKFERTQVGLPRHSPPFLAAF